MSEKESYPQMDRADKIVLAIFIAQLTLAIAFLVWGVFILEDFLFALILPASLIILLIIYRQKLAKMMLKKKALLLILGIVYTIAIVSFSFWISRYRHCSIFYCSYYIIHLISYYLLICSAIFTIIMYMSIIPFYNKRISEILSCPNCGSGINKDDPFCNKCGLNIPERSKFENFLLNYKENMRSMIISEYLLLKFKENKRNKITILLNFFLVALTISFLIVGIVLVTNNFEISFIDNFASLLLILQSTLIVLVILFINKLGRMMLELKLPYMITSAIYVSAIIISTFGIRFCLIEDCGTGLYYITYTIIISSTIITVLISKYVIPFFSKLRQKVVKSKANRIIIIAYLGMLLLAIPLLPWLLAGSYSNAWIFYLVFFIVPGIPFAIIILLIIFKMEISRMKWWKRLSLYCCIILLLAGIIYCGVMGWAVAIHLFT